MAALMDMTCKACGKVFTPKFSFQVKRLADGSAEYFCSQMCANPLTRAATFADCAICGKRFGVTQVYQVIQTAAGNTYYCSNECRVRGTAPAPSAGPPP